jgi:predicted metal-dependent phosphoesterase TrpH
VESQNKQKLQDEYWIHENHSHTDYTDGVFSPHRMVDFAVLQGITSLTISDHNTTKPAIMAKKYAENTHNNKIQIDIGIELSTDA